MMYYRNVYNSYVILCCAIDIFKIHLPPLDAKLILLIYVKVIGIRYLRDLYKGSLW